MTEAEYKTLIQRVLESGNNIKDLAEEISMYSGQQVSDDDLLDYLLRKKKMSDQTKRILGKIFNITFTELE